MPTNVALRFEWPVVRFAPIATPDGKLTPELIRPYLHGFGDHHHSQPGAIYLSQCTELGTIYTPTELKAITSLAHQYRYACSYGWCPYSQCLCCASPVPQRANGRLWYRYTQLRRNQKRFDDGWVCRCFWSVFESRKHVLYVSSRHNWPLKCGIFLVSLQLIWQMNSG